MPTPSVNGRQPLQVCPPPKSFPLSPSKLGMLFAQSGQPDSLRMNLFDKIADRVRVLLGSTSIQSVITAITTRIQKSDMENHLGVFITMRELHEAGLISLTVVTLGKHEYNKLPLALQGKIDQWKFGAGAVVYCNDGKPFYVTCNVSPLDKRMIGIIQSGKDVIIDERLLSAIRKTILKTACCKIARLARKLDICWWQIKPLDVAGDLCATVKGDSLTIKIGNGKKLKIAYYCDSSSARNICLRYGMVDKDDKPIDGHGFAHMVLSSEERGLLKLSMIQVQPSDKQLTMKYGFLATLVGRILYDCYGDELKTNSCNVMHVTINGEKYNIYRCNGYRVKRTNTEPTVSDFQDIDFIVHNGMVYYKGLNDTVTKYDNDDFALVADTVSPILRNGSLQQIGALLNAWCGMIGSVVTNQIGKFVVIKNLSDLEHVDSRAALGIYAEIAAAKTTAENTGIYHTRMLTDGHAIVRSAFTPAMKLPIHHPVVTTPSEDIRVLACGHKLFGGPSIRAGESIVYHRVNGAVNWDIAAFVRMITLLDQYHASGRFAFGIVPEAMVMYHGIGKNYTVRLIGCGGVTHEIWQDAASQLSVEQKKFIPQSLLDLLTKATCKESKLAILRVIDWHCAFKAMLARFPGSYESFLSSYIKQDKHAQLQQLIDTPIEFYSGFVCHGYASAIDGKNVASGFLLEMATAKTDYSNIQRPYSNSVVIARL